MGKNLTIPKKGDLVVCVRGGFIGSQRFARQTVKEGEMGMVTFARHSTEGSGGAGHLTVTWFNGVKFKYHLDGRWARNASGWKQWLRVVEHKT